MIIIPAIDLRDGKVVRLIQGDYDREHIYSHDAVSYARRWESDGAQLIHIVDLDGARQGELVNTRIVEEIIDNVSIPLEFGGGVRSYETVRKLDKIGVKRIVIGTKAFDEDFLKRVITDFGAEKIVVGIDAADGIVKTDGWLTSSGMSVKDMCAYVEKCGVKHIIYTDIKKDGTLTGPNIESLQEVLDCSSLQVVNSGGIGTKKDIIAITTMENNRIFGIIVGKALYEGTLALKEAIEATQLT